MRPARVPGHDELRRVCVYCGSTPGTRPGVPRRRPARPGRPAGRPGIGVVYGGATVGLMGRVADAALEAGGEVIGVLPDKLFEQRGRPRRARPSCAWSTSMHERKALMARARRRLRRPARRLRHHRGGRRGGHLDPARHPRQAGRPARRRRLLRPPAGVPRPVRSTTACSARQPGPAARRHRPGRAARAGCAPRRARPPGPSARGRATPCRRPDRAGPAAAGAPEVLTSRPWTSP